MMQRLAFGAIAFATGLLVGCGGGNNGERFPDVVTLGEGEVFPNITNSSVAVGDNRFALQLFGADDEPVLGAAVHLRFYDLAESDRQPAFEANARFIPIQTGYVDELSGGTREVTGEDGVYVANVRFPRDGSWGVFVRVTVNGQTLKDAPFRFNVLERSVEPAVGEAAPRSVQPTTATQPIAEIDSSSPLRPAMHDITIADAIASGVPSVIAFATPAYCTNRLCAPVMDAVMDPLAAEYAGRAHFIHVEPYVLRDLRDGFRFNETPAVRDWRLPSEPWIFVVGADGRIAAKFEGVTAADEVRAALEAALR